MQIFTLSNSLKCRFSSFLETQAYIRSVLSRTRKCFLQKVSLYHYSALLSLLCSDNQHVCCSDTLPYTPCNVSSMYHDFEVKYHDFGLPIVKSMLFFSNVRTFANRFAS